MELFEKIAVQVPALGVLAVVVWMFLKFMKEMKSEFSAVMTDLNKQHLEARQITHEVIDRNTNAMVENARSNFQLASRLELLEQYLPAVRHKER